MRRQNKGFNPTRGAPNFRHVTTLRVKIASSPVKQTLIPARAGKYRFTGQFCSKSGGLRFCELARPDPSRNQQFIDVSPRPRYTQALRKKPLSFKYLARNSPASRTEPPPRGARLRSCEVSISLCAALSLEGVRMPANVTFAEVRSLGCRRDEPCSSSNRLECRASLLAQGVEPRPDSGSRVRQ